MMATLASLGLKKHLNKLKSRGRKNLQNLNCKVKIRSMRMGLLGCQIELVKESQLTPEQALPNKAMTEM